MHDDHDDHGHDDLDEDILATHYHSQKDRVFLRGIVGGRALHGEERIAAWRAHRQRWAELSELAELSPLSPMVELEPVPELAELAELADLAELAPWALAEKLRPSAPTMTPGEVQSLYYRVRGAYSETRMFDDGQHGDGQANDIAMLREALTEK